jgi:hypothetical protein
MSATTPRACLDRTGQVAVGSLELLDAPIAAVQWIDVEDDER